MGPDQRGKSGIGNLICLFISNHLFSSLARYICICEINLPKKAARASSTSLHCFFYSVKFFCFGCMQLVYSSLCIFLATGSKNRIKIVNLDCVNYQMDKILTKHALRKSINKKNEVWLASISINYSIALMHFCIIVKKELSWLCLVKYVSLERGGGI